MELQTMKVGSRVHPVIGNVESERYGVLPMVDLPMMSEYSWNLIALRSRLEDPEFYRTKLGEDVEAAIAQLRERLAEYEADDMGLLLAEARRA